MLLCRVLSEEWEKRVTIQKLRRQVNLYTVTMPNVGEPGMYTSSKALVLFT